MGRELHSITMYSFLSVVVSRYCEIADINSMVRIVPTKRTSFMTLDLFSSFDQLLEQFQAAGQNLIFCSSTALANIGSYNLFTVVYSRAREGYS